MTDSQQLAHEIRDIQQQIDQLRTGLETSAVAAVKLAWKSGHLLIEARQLVKHGDWELFCECCGFSTDTARRYTALAKTYPTEGQLIASGGLRQGYLALIVPAKPKSDSETVTRTNNHYLRYANELYRTIHERKNLDVETAREELRFLFIELADLFGVKI